MRASGADKRNTTDRRVLPTPVFSKFTFSGGRRKIVRRSGDRRNHIFVDLYSTRLLLIVVSLISFSCIDAYMTLTLIEKGIATEANPVMGYFLDFGVIPFTAFKFVITAVALIVLCLLKNAPITRIGLPVIIKIYAVVIAYEIYLYML